MTTLGKSISRSWFSLALIALLIFAIPSFFLLGLKLFGWDGSLNKWLQENVGLSYHIPVGVWAAIILFLVPMIILLLYFLKLKRKPLSVPSTFLWKKSIEDLHVNSLFQWLRENVLLLLQLLAILLLIYAILDFRLHGGTTSGQHYIIMIDNSASMSATDVEPNRLEWAKREALKEIDATTDGDFGMVIEFNSTANTLQSYTNNRGLLRKAVESIERTQRPTRIEDALALAESLANPRRSGDEAGVVPANVEPGKERTYVPAEGIKTEIYLFSDGRFADMPEFSLGNLRVHFRSAGKRDTEIVTAAMRKSAGLPETANVTEGPARVNNLALGACSVTRDESDPALAQVFVRVLNFRNQEVSTRVQLDVLVNGRTRGILERPVLIPARSVRQEKAAPAKTEQGDEVEQFRIGVVPGETSVTFELKDIDDTQQTVLNARILKAEDDLPLDDQAWLVISAVRKGRVLLVSTFNPVLDAFFDDPAIREVATVTRLTPKDLATDKYRRPAMAGEFDLVIFDRCAPAKEDDLPQANTFFIGSVPPPWTKDTEEKFDKQIRGWEARHPLMRYLVSLDQIGFDEVFRVKELPPRTPRLLESRDSLFLFTLSRQSFTDLVLTFPLITDKGEYNTTWWRLPSFPLFLQNMLMTLGNVRDETNEETIKPGMIRAIRPDTAIKLVQVTDPEGKVYPLDRGTRTEFSFGDTRQIGAYRVSWDGEWRSTFAVNLLDSEESNLEPRPSVRFGSEHVVSGEERGQPRELWKWLVVLALGLLLGEWYIYNKRVYV